MSNSSYNTHSSFYKIGKDIRGGEKKVMKKSLSVVLSSAMAFSMFASVAFGKTSADFNDLKDLDAATKAKFDALISAGIFDGVAEGQFGLTQNMTRAQAAKVLALIYGVKVDETVKTSSFSDVKGDDAANGWAIPYIEAAKKAGLIDGMTDTTFAPGQNVTLGQFATLLVKGLGKKVDTTGTPWYADAIKQATDLKLLPAGTDGSKLATRSDLVLGAYEGKAQYGVTGKVSVTGLKATGAKKLEVTFSEPVDTAKATLTIKKGAATVTSAAPVWSADKKSAVLNLDVKLDTATYTVELGGLDAAAIGTKSASVAAEKEALKKIEFLTSSEVLPKAAQVRIDFKATNQYGEQSDLSASNFTIQSGQNNVSNISGKQAFYLNNDTLAKDTKYPVTIIHGDSGLSVSKVFTVGEAPTVSKIELGDIIYPSGVTRLEAGSKEAYVKFTAYDQYGIPVTKDVVGTGVDAYGLNTNRGITRVVSDSSVVTLDANPFTDFDGDGNLDIKLTSGASLTQDKEVTLTLFANGTGQSVSKAIKVVVAKNPATLELGAPSTIAVGDTNKYIPLTVKDTEGNVLSTEDVVSAAKAGKFTVYATSSNVTLKTGDASIETEGADRGKIKITSANSKGNVSVYASINGSTNAPVSTSFTVEEARVATSLKNTTVTANKLIASRDASHKTTNKPKFKVYDQYGGEFSPSTMPAGYSVTATVERVSGDVAALESVVIGTTVDPDAAQVTLPALTLSVSDNVYRATATNLTFKQIFDKEAVITAGIGKTGTFKLTYKIMNGANEVTSITKQFQVVDGKESGLVYTVAWDGAKDNTLFAAMTEGITATNVNGGVQTKDLATISAMKPAKGFALSAKDAAGNAVSVPGGSIIAVASTNSVVASVYGTKVVGNDTGTAQVTVTYQTETGVKSSTLDVTVKDAPIAVDTIVVDKTSQTKSIADINGAFAISSAVMNKVTVTDQYGSSYVWDNPAMGATQTQTLMQYNPTLGLRFYISEVKTRTAATTGDTVTINDTTGVITYTGANKDIASFTVTLVAPNGKSVSTQVFLNQ